jgi:hypothetical protein
MKVSSKKPSNIANLSTHLPSDTVENRARLQLLFIGSLFVTCATVGYLRMGDLVISTQSVPLIGTLLGM